MNQDSKQQEVIESNKAYTMAKVVCKSQTQQAATWKM